MEMMFENMTEQDWKEFFQKQMELEAEEIMKQVNADPKLKDFKLSPEKSQEMWENIQRMIREHEKE